MGIYNTRSLINNLNPTKIFTDIHCEYDIIDMRLGSLVEFI